MTESNQKQLGKTLWNIADPLRGAMDADDFRDYMLSFLFLRYLSDNYETAAKKELGRDYPKLGADDRRVPLALRKIQIFEQTVPVGAIEHAAFTTAYSQKLDALKTHKKGLMQQLFPSPEDDAS